MKIFLDFEELFNGNSSPVRSKRLWFIIQLEKKFLIFLSEKRQKQFLAIEIVTYPAKRPLWFDQKNLNRIKYLI